MPSGETFPVMGCSGEDAPSLQNLGLMAGMIAHDFKNMLTGIMGYASLTLAALPPDSAAEEYVRRIEETAERAEALANELLQYAGGKPPRREATSAVELIDDMVRTVASVVPPNVALRRMSDEGTPDMVVDCTQVRQVVLNLIMNAIHAVGANDGEVRVKTGAAEFRGTESLRGNPVNVRLEGRYVYIEVTDTGCGMDDATIKHMFDCAFTTKSDGHGLGLAEVRVIVRRHNGGIEVKSRPGEGTGIRVFFPAAITIPGAN